MSRPASTSLVRGACPGVVAPLEAADGMLLRVRVPGGVIAADGLRTVAGVAERFGSGVVELTVRANLQIRGVRPSDVAAAGEQLVLAGLALADPVRDERRDVIGSPLAGHDPTELVDLSGVLAEVADRLATEPGLDGLPPKFGVVLDGGGSASVRSIPADIALGAVRTADGRTALQLELGRALDHGDPRVCIEVAHAVPVVLAAAHLAAIHGERLATLVDRLGREAVVETITSGTSTATESLAAPMSQGCRPVGTPTVDTWAERNAIDEPGGTVHPGDDVGHPAAVDAARWPTPRRSAHHETAVFGPVDASAAPPGPVAGTPAPVGASAHRDGDRVNLGAAPFLGRTTPAALRSIAEMTDTTDASIRLTPWRGLVLVDVSRSQREAVTATMASAGFSADPTDRAHLVSACVGRPGCAASRADTQAAGQTLLRNGRLTSRIHLSGCEKRCGAGAAPTVVADEDGTFEVGPW